MQDYENLSVPSGSIATFFSINKCFYTPSNLPVHNSEASRLAPDEVGIDGAALWQLPWQCCWIPFTVAKQKGYLIWSEELMVCLFTQGHTTMKRHLEYWLIAALMHFFSFVPFPFVLVLFCIIPIVNTEPQNNLSHHIECKCMFSNSALPLNWQKKWSVSLWFSPPKRVSRALSKMVDILVLILWETYSVINSCREQGYIKFHSLLCCLCCFQVLS